MSHVLYVPLAKVNLLSVAQAGRHGVKFEFSDISCSILSGSGDLVATAYREGSAYVLRPNMIKSMNHSYIGVTTKETPQLWHRRAVHLGMDNLACMTTMVKGMAITSDQVKEVAAEPCEACFKGKQTRLPFGDSQTSTTSPMELFVFPRNWYTWTSVVPWTQPWVGPAMWQPSWTTTLVCQWRSR
jgi:hypothetical protein